MKKLTLLTLLIATGLNAFSQREEYDQAFHSHIPAGIGKEVNLPDPGHGAKFDLSRFNPLYGNSLVFVIVSDSMYYNVFSKYKKDTLPEIDFVNNELVLYMACGQCLAYCEHSKGTESCHRNMCYYQRAWFLREKCSNL